MKRNVLGILLAGAIGAALITGCGAASSGTARSSAPQQTPESAPEDGDAGKSAPDTPDLTGHTLMIYCGAGMTKPFQEIADSFKGVEKSFAIQAGRELRIMVIPEDINDEGLPLLAREVAKKIEDELEYPGQIKVSLIRETRATDYAK